MNTIFIFKQDTKLINDLKITTEEKLKNFYGKHLEFYKEKNLTFRFFDDDESIETLENEWKGFIDENDFYIILHNGAKSTEAERNYLKNQYREVFGENVILRSHTHQVYKKLIPQILSGECTLDNIKSYFPDKELENCFELIFKNYDSSNDFSKEVKALHDYQKSKT